ncbi:uncharacterized protein [Ambystoma mexicanum]|uniref:uncharacterized protein n=1 Tax=Ambystoma mexicanum TaxID=8296 RepID=UPI0037E8823D
MTRARRAKLHQEPSSHDLNLELERKDKELNMSSCTSLDNTAHVPRRNLHSLQGGEMNRTRSFSEPPISSAMHDREIGARPKVMKFLSKAKRNSESSAEAHMDIHPSGISPLNGKAEKQSKANRFCIGISPGKRKCRNKLSAEPDLDKNVSGISPLNGKAEEESEASRFCIGTSPDKRKCRNELSAKLKINISCIKGDPEEESQDIGLSTGTHLTHEPQITRTKTTMTSARRAKLHQEPSSHDLNLELERKDKELNMSSCTSLDNTAHVPRRNLHSLQGVEMNHTRSFSEPPISSAMHDREIGARPKVMKFLSKAKRNSESSAEAHMDINPSGISPLNGKAEKQSKANRFCIGISPGKRKCRNKLSAEPDLDKNASGISPLNGKAEEESEASRFCIGTSPDKRQCRNELSAKLKINISCIKGDPEEESQDIGLSTGTHLTHEPQITRTK